MKSYRWLMAVFAMLLFIDLGQNTVLANEVPPGFHRMPDGSIMANNPANAVAPDGFHLMPDGTLMPNMVNVASKTARSDAGIHHHGTGKFMFQYQYMRMKMDGVIDGTDSISQAQLTAVGGRYGYMMVPDEMRMDMHMIMAMFGMSEELTFMAMFNYLDNSMTMSDKQTMRSSGAGDVLLELSYLWNTQYSFALGMSLPNGDIDQFDTMQMNGNTTKMKMPYAMQLGSGTYDFVPSVSYQDESGSWNWGADGSYIYRMGENDNNYRLGNKIEVSTWGAWQWNHSTSFKTRLDIFNAAAIDGFDTEIMPAMMNMKTTPLANPENTGRTQADLYFGLSGISRAGGFSFDAEFGLPIFQSVNGVQMKAKHNINLNLKWII